MSSNLKIGLWLSAAMAGIAAITYIFVAYVSSSPATPKPNLSTNSNGSPQPTTSSRDSELGSKAAASPDINSANKVDGAVTAPNSTAAETVLSRAQRQEQKALRAKAVDELSRALSKGIKADPKEVMAAFDRIEKTIPTPEGKQQIMLSRKVYEHGLKIHTLTSELSTIATSTQPRDKARQQVLIAEITDLQTQIQNAASATREYAAAQRKTLK